MSRWTSKKYTDFICKHMYTVPSLLVSKSSDIVVKKIRNFSSPYHFMKETKDDFTERKFISLIVATNNVVRALLCNDL